jgi:hypothetical protein
MSEWHNVSLIVFSVGGVLLRVMISEVLLANTGSWSWSLAMNGLPTIEIYFDFLPRGVIGSENRLDEQLGKEDKDIRIIILYCH